MTSHQIPWHNLQASGKQPERRVKIQTLTIQGPLSLSLSLSMCLLSLVSKVIPGNEVGKVLDDVKNQLHSHHKSNSTGDCTTVSTPEDL